MTLRIYIIAADTPEALRLGLAPGHRFPPRVEALQEIVGLRDLADPARMRAVAVQFRDHFKDHAHG
ncbi:hypothetical protein [Sphingobium aromaticiconvertens]|uniref:hypothetical protein n=1 Tax=Sphingobium aromaticiconvertens TaxID=365341 RepID=UPI0030184CEB